MLFPPQAAGLNQLLLGSGKPHYQVILLLDRGQRPRYSIILITDSGNIWYQDYRFRVATTWRLASLKIAAGASFVS